MLDLQISKFILFAPQLLPKLIKAKDCDSIDFNDDSAVLTYKLEEPLSIGCVMNMLDEAEIGLVFLYYAKDKSNPQISHCCMFSHPQFCDLMYSINLCSNSNGLCDKMFITIFEEKDIWENSLEDDYNLHINSFNFINSISLDKLLKYFLQD